MSIAAEITRITNAKTAIKAAIEEKGVSVGDGKIDSFAEKIAQIVTGGIDGAACGKFTWNGSYPVYCDCSALETAPTAFMLYCPYFVNLGTGDYHSLIAAKGVGAAISTAVVRVTATNVASVATYQSGIVYDAENKAVKLANSIAGNFKSGQDYYWIAV